MLRRPLAAGWALLAACTPSPVFQLPTPDPSAATLLMGFNTPGGPSRISVVEPDEPWFLVAQDFPLELRVLSYARAFPDLAVGPLPPLGEQPRCDLLDYQSAAGKLLRARADIAGSWVSTPAPDNDADAWLYGAALPKCIGTCTTWTETLRYDQSRRFVGLKVAHEEAVGVDAGGGLVRITGAAFEPICEPPGGGGLVTAGTWDGGDAVWIGYADGRIERLLLSEQRAGLPCLTHSAARVPSGQPINALDVSPAAEAFELFVLVGQRGISTWMARWDGQRFGPEIAGSPAQFSMQVLRLSGGRAIGTTDSQEILVIDGARAERVELPILSTVEGPTTAQSLEADGPSSAWVGIAHLGPCRFELPGRWTVPTDRTGTFSVDNVVRFPGRTYFTSALTRLHEVPDRGPGCPDAEAFPRHTSAALGIQARLLRRLNATQLLVGQALEDDGGSTILSVSARILTRSGGAP